MPELPILRVGGKNRKKRITHYSAAHTRKINPRELVAVKVGRGWCRLRHRQRQVKDKCPAEFGGVGKDDSCHVKRYVDSGSR